MTFNEIKNRILGFIKEADDTLDTRPDSLIYTAALAGSKEKEILYNRAEQILDESYADTASRENLIRRCKERGIYPKAATKAIVKGEFSGEVPLGTRFAHGEYIYITTEKIDTNIYKMECETVGIGGNYGIGDIYPIDNGLNLEYAKITKILIPGEDEEKTEDLRKRYFNSFESQAFGGNRADYKKKVNALQGVGGCKAKRTPFGGGTVGVVIISSSYDIPSAELISLVQNVLDPIETTGEGDGIAPIGHVVTVSGVKSKIINIETNITYQQGWISNDNQIYIEKELDNYYLELSQLWQDADNLIVRISQIESRLLNLPGVVDITDTKINGATTNISLESDEIPKRGDFNDKSIV